MTQTGKKARQQYGNRYAAKRARTRKPKTKKFGKLPFSCVGKSAGAFNPAPNYGKAAK